MYTNLSPHGKLWVIIFYVFYVFDIFDICGALYFFVMAYMYARFVISKEGAEYTTNADEWVGGVKVSGSGNSIFGGGQFSYGGGQMLTWKDRSGNKIARKQDLASAFLGYPCSPVDIG